MSAWAAPGSTAVVAVRQSIQPGWHTYWRNPGDSGGATSLSWTVPEGVQPGEIVWPLPQRQRLSGLMNYGYEGEVYLPVPVEVPATARAGTVLPLTVKALYLVCSAEMCVPDELTLRLDLPVREGAAPLDTRHGAAIMRVLETAPRPAGIEARVSLENGVLVLSAAGGPLAGRDPGPSYFFPFEGGVIDHPAAQTGSWGPQGLTLRLQPGRATTASGLTGPVAGVLATAHGAFEIRAEPGVTLAGTSGSGPLAAAADAGPATASPDPTSLAVFARALLFAVLGGLILNLMPCVFPILAMKAMALARLGGAGRAAVRREALAYTAGVVLGFLVIGGALLGLRLAGSAAGWGFQFTQPAFVAVMAWVMLAVGLNLSGVFAIRGPVVSGPRGGLAGSFATGSLAVLVATPCTAPFMAVALGAALAMPALPMLLVFAAMGLGMALPYALLAVAPGLARALPRPGAWMERLRQFLAFPMYAAAAWLVWVLAQLSGADGVALGLGGALLVGFAAWAMGQGRLGRAGALAAGLGGRALVAGLTPPPPPAAGPPR
ncbi:MAG: thiol:disulfide interchange protein, partial [Rubritepida sp.]|nr:thiol:disulfide interchange protein [Rubritepida sp.]